MTTHPSVEEIQRALWENESAPNGLLRNARAEELVAAAESTGEGHVIRRALFGLIKAYEYSTERGKMMVPFARLLQEWDRDPAAFGAHDTHTFHWMFKWVSSGMLTLPEMPLATMEQWLAEMERRYRIAGFSERAVRQAEFELANDTGDTVRAARAFAAWTAADRDRMANCHACELNEQGQFWLDQGQDDKALRIWEPVLGGHSSCMEEPHRVLAKSLLPLVRTGRIDQARANHLRGYRMTRGNESLLPSIGQHIEFCALTGNEGRGLELLAEHAAHLASDGNPWARQQLFTGVLVLLRRLLRLGLADEPAVAYGGAGRTVAELHDLLDAQTRSIADRFDARNGSDVVSRRLAERLEREPLTDRLPLGVRTTHLTQAAPVTPVSVPAAPARPDSTVADARPDPTVAELAAEARALRAQGHPRAASLWDRIEALVSAGEDAPDPLLAAEVQEHQALSVARKGEAPMARGLFEQVVAAYRAVGDPSRAALNELRVLYAAVQGDASPEEVRELLTTAEASARALDPADPTRRRRIASVALTGVKLEPVLTHGESGGDAGHEEQHGHEHQEHQEHHHVHERLDAGLAAFVAEFGDGAGEGAGVGAAGVDDLVAEAEQARAEQAWRSGDAAGADALFASAAQRCLDAGRPWDAAEPLARRASLLHLLGHPEQAEESARAALEHSAELVAPEELGRIRLTLAEVLQQIDGKGDEAAAQALEASHWFDAAGDTAVSGAYARHVLAQAYAASGRAAEAAEVMESALPDLVRLGDEQAVQSRDVLARSLRALGDHRAAAEQYLLAADVAKGWDDDRPHAQLATMAAECLSGAGLLDEASAAYHRAAGLWQAVGEPGACARVLRSLAWLEVQQGRADGARDLMARALEAVDGDDPSAELLVERARTWAQTAELLLEPLYEDEDEDEDQGEDEDEDEDEDQGEGDDAVAGADDAVQDPAGPSDAEHVFEADRVRGEAVELLDKAAAAYAALGPVVLDERVRCVVRTAWTERELRRADEAVARVRALIAEVSSSDTDEARSALPGLERTLEQLTAAD
ncbi:tetratricopeptide repeat protein [Streptomyces sp. ISL-10]|uniref:tetratricopeptide repeat protein n=1 Tax=Streptomyces sp. ISL-10 TaxID=2819172 RepID=UPI001BE5ED62|nr:tetratricopeptide repeat protein [Streptomyces sp. ISL-10]MBT2365970.1 tetratricopeptide repeat protein [Streptomyces sp. ISL-10]